METALPPATDGEDNTTTVAPGTPTPETYIDEDTDVVVLETTVDPDVGFSTEPSPHGEYSDVNGEFYRIWKYFTMYLDLPVAIKHQFVLNDVQG